MNFIEKGRQGLRKILEERPALLFVQKDRSVQWYKFVIIIPLEYIAFPIDLIPDGLLFFGQIDDLIVVRFSSAL